MDLLLLMVYSRANFQQVLLLTYLTYIAYYIRYQEEKVG